MADPIAEGRRPKKMLALLHSSLPFQTGIEGHCSKNWPTHQAGRPCGMDGPSPVCHSLNMGDVRKNMVRFSDIDSKLRSRVSRLWKWNKGGSHNLVLHCTFKRPQNLRNNSILAL